MQLISPNTNIDFVRKTRFFAIVSILAVVASIFLIATRGFNLGSERPFQLETATHQIPQQ